MSFFDSPMLAGLGGFMDWLVRAKTALWVGKVMSALGLGFVAQKFLYDPLIAQAATYWTAIPAAAAAWVHAFGIDQGVSLVLSAYGIRGASKIFMRRVTPDVAP
jgi:hypothetical protein